MNIYQQLTEPLMSKFMRYNNCNSFFIVRVRNSFLEQESSLSE